MLERLTEPVMPPHEGSQTTHVPSLVFLQWALLYALGDHHEQRQHLAGAEQVSHPPTASPPPPHPLAPCGLPSGCLSASLPGRFPTPSSLIMEAP